MVNYMNQEAYYKDGERPPVDMLRVRSFDMSDSTYLLTISTIPRKTVLLLNIPSTDPDGNLTDFLQVSRGHVVSVTDDGGGEWTVLLERELGWYPNDREGIFIIQGPAVQSWPMTIGHHLIRFGSADYQRSSWEEVNAILEGR